MTETELADLYTRYGYFIFRRCLAYLSDQASAQDAVQEVFARALRAAPRFRREAEPRTWLYRIADNHCIDMLRKRRRSGHEPDAIGHQEPRTCSFNTDDLDAVVTARQAMASLDPDSRRMAVLYFLDELTQDELAAELGLSRRTVGKRLRVLGTRVRALLGKGAFA